MLENFLSTNINLALLSPRDHMLWCGDFNHHHPLWEEDSNCHLFSQPKSIDPLLNLLATYNMRFTLPLSIPTYKTTQGNWTRPDNVWRSNNPLDPIVICNVKPSLHPPCADHLPIITELNMLNGRPRRTLYMGLQMTWNCMYSIMSLMRISMLWARPSISSTLQFADCMQMWMQGS